MSRNTMDARRRVTAAVIGVFAVSLAVVAVAVAGPPTPGTLTLVAPTSGAVVVQDDHRNDELRHGSHPWVHRVRNRLQLDRTPGEGRPPLPGRDDVQHGTSPACARRDRHDRDDTSTRDACSSYVADGNLTDWHWQVTALGNGGHKALAHPRRPG